MKMSKDIEFELNQGKVVKLPSMRKIYVLCAVIPFVLFGARITSPLWTDNFIVYIFALAPFYTFFAILSVNFIPSMILVLSCAFDKAFTEIPRDADLYVADD